jgi:filamentous hemagglutinin
LAERPEIAPEDVGHIFRNAPGHMEDTPENRRLLLDLIADEDAFVGADRYGTRWYARTLPDGRQLWAQRRGSRLRNGGVNAPPRDFASPVFGLKRER